MLTVKPDWLNDFLAENGCCVSGHPSFAQSLGISGSVTLRFIRLKERLVYFLAIQPSAATYQEEYLAAFEAGNFDRLRQKFTPLVQVFYTEGGSEFDLFYPELRRFRKVSFAEMARLVASHYKGFGEDVGAGKEINKSINDAFQVWTRAFLSKYLVANDLDAFTLAGTVPVFLELKRVVQPLPTWRPYLDDTANFNSLNAIAQQQGGAAVTLAYHTGNAAQVAYHRHIIPYKKEHITGQYQLVSPETIAQDLLAVDLRHEPLYTSKQWRKKPDYLI